MLPNMKIVVLDPTYEGNNSSFKYAAGLKLKVENIPAFQEKFEKVVSEQIDDQLLIPRIEIDATINFSDITPKFIRILKQLAPFGPGNMMPVFRSDNILSGRTSLVGGDKKHLRGNLHQHNDPSISFNAIGKALQGPYRPLKGTYRAL